MRKIPLTKPFFTHDEIDLVADCLRSGWVTQGPFVAKMEKMFSSLHKVKFALATSSCTSALHLAALALGLRAGDEVIVPAYTWVSSANCVEYTGAKAVFSDIDINTFNIDPIRLEKAITSKTKAIVVVHLFGLSAEMDAIRSIAKKYNLRIIEDAACAVGCRYDEVPVGGLGDIGCFSFHPRKIITTGEGGMVTTNSRALAGLVNSLRNHGTWGPEPGPGAMRRPQDMSRVVRIGYNMRLSDIQGAIGIAQMLKLNTLLEKRQKLASRYNDELRDVDELVIPFLPEKCSHTYQSYVVRLKSGGKKRRDKVMGYLSRKGIWTRPGTHAVPRLGAYRNKYKLLPSSFVNAIRAEDETIALPLYHAMKQSDCSYVAGILKRALCSRSYKPY